MPIILFSSILFAHACASSLEANKWHFFSCVYKSRKIKMYFIFLIFKIKQKDVFVYEESTIALSSID